MYYRIDLQKREISTVSFSALDQEAKHLHNLDYEFIFLSNVKAFIMQKQKLPNKSIFIALNEIYSHLLAMFLPILVNQEISIIIFLPIIISSNCSEYSQTAVQQLIQFLFSEEFKNMSSYTHENSEDDSIMSR